MDVLKGKNNFYVNYRKNKLDENFLYNPNFCKIIDATKCKWYLKVNLKSNLILSSFKFKQSEIKTPSIEISRIEGKIISER